MKKLARLATMITLSTASVHISGCEYGELIRLYFQEQEYQKDQELIAKIKGALLADPQVRDAPVVVDAYLGDVHLSGTISSPEQKQRAEEVIEQVGGVESLHNDLKVQAP
jgi:osmotically-inducible protein OsmY